MKKKRILIIAAIVLVLAFAAAAIYVAWAHTTALELFPEGEWEKAVWKKFMDENEQPLDPAQLRDVLEDQTLRYGGGLDFLPNYAVAVTIDGEEWLLGVSEGYTAVIPAEGSADAKQYRDDGTIYRLVKDLLMPELG